MVKGLVAHWFFELLFKCRKPVEGFETKSDLIDLYIYVLGVFLAALGLRCCTRSFSSCGELGLLFAVVREYLIAVASLVAEHGL